jgi:hypothetical protein
VAPGKWPIVGERAPRDVPEVWELRVEGLVERPLRVTLAELQRWPAMTQAVDVHCVTRWSRPGMVFRGVPLARVLEAARPQEGAKFVSFVARSARDHSTSLPLADALSLSALLAYEAEGKALAVEHGGPLRVVVPGRYFYKSLKWLERIDLLAEDRLGYWEGQAGYHNTADPWREERYMATALDKQEAARLLAKRDFSGRDLRSIAAAGMELRGLRARGALLRDADFSRSDLRGACFDGANLSNARLIGSDLRGAMFLGADVEGADFTGADLREADLRGASLFGATFFDESATATTGAKIDGTVRVTTDQLEALTPSQAAFLRGALGLSDKL